MDMRSFAGIGVLKAVTEAGSFARAAEALDMTASGVSRAVARLELRMGIRLFDRNPRSVALTEDGRRLYEQVLPLLNSLDDITTAAGTAATVINGRLRVSVDPWFARLVLAPRLPELLRRYPAMVLDMTVSNHREEMMTGVDVAVRFGPPDDSSLIARKLLETRVLTVASPAYLKQHGTPQVPADVGRHDVILFRDPQTRRPFRWEFQRKGRTLDIPVTGRLVTDDPSVAIAACVGGHGLFQSLELGLEPWLRRGRLVQVLAQWSDERFPLHAYHVSRQLPPARIRAFLEFLQAIT